jgi:hypothetical protein
MKPLFAFAILILTIFGCKNTEKKESLRMSGAYRMLLQSVDLGTRDSSYTNEQLKIYTDQHMMFARINSPDSISGFGIGSYSVNGDTVTENLIFYADDSTANSTPVSFKLHIDKTDKGFRQFIGGMEGNSGQKVDLTEKYDSVGSGAVTPLDGAWKQSAVYWIKGKDTSKYEATQYKTYYSGYVIWGNSSKDSSNKIHTRIGFGKFTMPTANKVRESMIASTVYQVRGKDFDIGIEMPGNDKFKQTIENADGSKTVEVYEKLKK